MPLLNPFKKQQEEWQGFKPPFDPAFVPLVTEHRSPEDSLESGSAVSNAFITFFVAMLLLVLCGLIGLARIGSFQGLPIETSLMAMFIGASSFCLWRLINTTVSGLKNGGPFGNFCAYILLLPSAVVAVVTSLLTIMLCSQAAVLLFKWIASVFHL